MAKATTKLRLLHDHNVPDSVGRFLQRRGHSVFRLRKHMPEDSPDPVVAEAAQRSARMLVTWDKDFNQQRFMQPRFNSLSRIALSGEGPSLLAAVKAHIELVEYQWERCRRTGDRMIAHLKVGQVKFRT